MSWRPQMPRPSHRSSTMPSHPPMDQKHDPYHANMRYHPYARYDGGAPYGGGGGDHGAPSSYGDYYNGGSAKSYLPTSMGMMMGQQMINCVDDDEQYHSGAILCPPTASQAQKEVKKPPRPYTEYNIFFQLERERILGELEEEHQQKNKEEGGNGEEDMKQENDAKLLTDESKVKEEGKDKEKDGDNNEAGKPTGQFRCPKPNVPLNIPSDANDVLPRSPRFAHLKLAPLWYDSTHRLAESKRNKARRKHRKTHGLVGFLDLTRRIAQAWKDVDPETKAYCKKVASRQLQIYKEELKMVKAGSGGGSGFATPGYAVGMQTVKNQGEQAQRQKLMQVQMKMRKENAPKNATPPAPPKAAAKGAATGSRPTGDEHGSISNHQDVPPTSQQDRYNKYWQQYHQYSQYYQYQHQHPHYQGGPPQPHQQHRAYRHGNGQNSHGPRNGGSHYYQQRPPTIPPLTPPSGYAEDARLGGHCGGGGHPKTFDKQQHNPHQAQQFKHNHPTPLDELMHRRKLYGSRTENAAVAAAKAGAKRKGRQGGNKSHNKKGDETESGAKPGIAQQSYLSPSDAMADDNCHKTSTSAVTPSPNRRHAARSSSSGSNADSPATPTTPPDDAPTTAADGTPSQLPMKKRRKKLFETSSEDTCNSPSSVNDANKKGMSPGSIPKDSRKSDSSVFSLSPSTMLTPGGTSMPPFLFGASPRMSLLEQQHNSPLPYIDWGSPQDMNGSPHENGIDGTDMMPPHLSVPGSYNGGYGPPPHSSRSGYSQGYPVMHPPPPPPPPHVGGGVRFADAEDNDALDLDDEEMELLWNKLATHARKKRMRGRDMAARWMSYYHNSGGSFAMASPGAMSGSMNMAHSFSSPMERSDVGDSHASPQGLGKSLDKTDSKEQKNNKPPDLPPLPPPENIEQV